MLCWLAEMGACAGEESGQAHRNLASPRLDVRLVGIDRSRSLSRHARKQAAGQQARSSSAGPEFRSVLPSPQPAPRRGAARSACRRPTTRLTRAGLWPLLPVHTSTLAQWLRLSTRTSTDTSLPPRPTTPPKDRSISASRGRVSAAGPRRQSAGTRAAPSLAPASGVSSGARRASACTTCRQKPLALRRSELRRGRPRRWGGKGGRGGEGRGG